LKRLALAAQANGVKYVHGAQGHVTQLLFNASGKCIGVLNKAGEVHLAEVVIVTTGAQIGELVNVEGEITAKAMCVATIQLTPEEVERYKSFPMVDNFEQGS
jgi:sarcosine oxidase/L-pipecolate oxidase